MVRIKAINGLQDYTLEEAWNTSDSLPVDILLSHETYLGRLSGLHPTGRLDRSGSGRLLELIKSLAPQHHFFGHYHWYYPEQKIENNSGKTTRTIGLNEVAFDKESGRLLPGCFGVLKTSDQMAESSFEIVEEEWFKNLTLDSCSHVL
jgi:hypothetical protein